MVRLIGLIVLLALLAVGAVFFAPGVRSQLRAIVRPEPPAQITPLTLTLPRGAQGSPSEPPATPTARASPAAASRPTATRSPAPPPSPTATPGPVVVNGQVYDAYLPAASKEKQAYQYSCEFDAAWVILQTYGIAANVDDLIAAVGLDMTVEPYIEETAEGFLIHGGDITTSFSGNYKENFLARSSGEAMRKVFEHFNLRATPVHDRAGVEAALRAGQLVWMKTTVDFKKWRPAIWVMPDGRTRRTVLGNDHAVVAIGFSDRGVVIRDVLGPTSSNRQRPYEYEVEWDVFLAAWGAQEFDGLAVARLASDGELK